MLKTLVHELRDPAEFSFLPIDSKCILLHRSNLCEEIRLSCRGKPTSLHFGPTLGYSTRPRISAVASVPSVRFLVTRLSPFGRLPYQPRSVGSNAEFPWRSGSRCRYFFTAHIRHRRSIFEHAFKHMGNTERNGGEYDSPRSLVQAIVRVVKSQVGEKISDDACSS